MYVQIVSSIGTGLAAIAAAIGVFLAWKVHNEQNVHGRRQLIVPLWEHMNKLTRINYECPDVDDVINAVNTLELVALCCQGGIVDKTMIKQTFGEGFLEMYQSIEKCPTLPGVGKLGKELTGKQLLLENPAAMNFYKELSAEKPKQETKPHTS